MFLPSETGPCFRSYASRLSRLFASTRCGEKCQLRRWTHDYLRHLTAR